MPACIGTEGFRGWLVRAAAGTASQMQIMYGVAGERRLSEWEAQWLGGYDGATPVRIGNAAYSHLQLDVYGEIMDAFHQARLAGLDTLERVWGAAVRGIRSRAPVHAGQFSARVLAPVSGNLSIRVQPANQRSERRKSREQGR